MVLIKRALDSTLQQHIVELVAELGIGQGGFYVPRYEDGARIHCHMMCLGWHWNPQSGAYEARRSNHDNAHPPAMPQGLFVLAQVAAAAAARADPASVGSRGLEGFEPDVRSCCSSRVGLSRAGICLLGLCRS